MNDLESDNSALSMTSFVFVLWGERKQRIYKLAGAKLFFVHFVRNPTACSLCVAIVF